LEFNTQTRGTKTENQGQRDEASWKINMEKHKWQHAGQVSNRGMS